jgi:hypothetical protein
MLLYPQRAAEEYPPPVAQLKKKNMMLKRLL